MGTDVPTRGEIQYRFEQTDRRIGGVEDGVRKLDDKLDDRVDDLKDALSKTRSEMAVMRVEMRQFIERSRAFSRALWAFAGGFVIFAVSVLFGTGKVG